MKRRWGIGTLSLLLAFMGVIWGFTLFEVCVGDIILNYLGLNAWTNGDTGIHAAAYYSLVFFVPAFILGLKNKNDFGATFGKITSAIVSVFLIASTLFLAV